MLDLVENPEDQFSHNEAHFFFGFCLVRNLVPHDLQVSLSLVNCLAMLTCKTWDGCDQSKEKILIAFILW